MENKVQFGVHQLLFREGDAAKKLYLIKSGQVLCLKASKDKLSPIFLATEDDIIGEGAIVGNSNYAYSAVTLATVELVEIPEKTFTDVLMTAPDWLSTLTETMINRFQTTANLIAENHVLSPSILSEEDFPSSLQNEFKKLINRTE